MTAHTDTTTPAAPTPSAPEPTPPGRRRNLILAAIIAAVLIVGGAIGGVAASRAATAQKLDNATTEYIEVAAEVEDLEAQAQETLSAAAVVNVSATGKLGGVDHPKIAALTDVIDQGYLALESIDSLPDPRTVAFANLAEAQDAVAQLKSVRDDINRTQENVAPAVAAVEAAVAEAELATATTAHTAAVESLTTQITDGEALLAESEGKANEDSRQALAVVLEEARTIRDQEVDPDNVEAITAHTESIGVVASKFSGPIGNVQYSLDSWNEEQTRQAAAGSSAPRSSSSTGTRKPSTGTGGGTSTGTAAPSAPQPQVGSGAGTGTGGSTSDGGGTWVETEHGFDTDLCGDTSGNTWEC